MLAKFLQFIIETCRNLVEGVIQPVKDECLLCLWAQVLGCLEFTWFKCTKVQICEPIVTGQRFRSAATVPNHIIWIHLPILTKNLAQIFMCQIDPHARSDEESLPASINILDESVIKSCQFNRLLLCLRLVKVGKESTHTMVNLHWHMTRNSNHAIGIGHLLRGSNRIKEGAYQFIGIQTCV